MPISADQFDHIDDDTPTFEGGTNAYDVLTFLVEHREQAFKQGEIADATDIPTGSISVVLSRLEDFGVVEHKGEYWKAAPDDRIASLEAMFITQQTVADRYGDEEEFDKDVWLEHAPEEQ